MFFLFFILFSFASTWFTQGLLHPLQTPSHVILILSIGLLIGQQDRLKINLLAFIFSLLSGFLLNQNISINWDFELILLVLALITGVLVISRLQLFSWLTLVLLFASGLSLGFNSMPIMIPGLGANSIYSWLIGAAFSIVSSTALTALLAFILNRYWNGIILRVLGSWIATSAIFVLTLMLAKH